ncbi:A-kinase anchor protein 12b [Diretmus argenteus]
MGAETSVHRDGRSQEEDASASASAQELSAEVRATQEGGGVHSKPLQKNGQIPSLTSLNGHSEDNTLTEVGQPDSVSVTQKEEAPETMDNIQDEVTPQVNREKVEKESPDANDIITVEEKAAEEKPEEANEVGFKKIFRFVGFKFTLKKDKSEEKDPVKLLTVKDKEGEEVSGADTAEGVKEEAATAEEITTEEKVVEAEASTTEADANKDIDTAATTEVPAEGTAPDTIDEEAKDEGAEKESETSPPSQEVAPSTFRKLFTGGLFSNLRKKASIKKSKEEEEKEAAVQEETTETKETVDVVEEEETVEVEKEAKEESPALTPEEAKSDHTPEPEVTVETPAPAADTTDETKPEEEKAEVTAEEEKAPVEVTSEAELLSSQEKVKVQGSPLRKLFTGAGLKKLSTKKQKSKKDAEAKLTESGEQATEQIQSSTDSADGAKPDSGASSPDDSGEHAIGAEAIQAVPSQESEGEVTSDGEKKKEGIIAWSSFKKLVTPKKRVKRSSESEDEASGEKPMKSATLSSTESAVFADKSSDEDAKEEDPTEEEPKTENTEKLVISTEESKKKMDTSVSWEALMCMGGAKKRTRRTSDSDDEETKIEDKALPEALEEEQEGKTDESPIVSTEEGETDGEVVSSPEPLSTPPERETAWGTLKRMMSKNKAKGEEKTEESSDQVLSDSEVPKEESSFSLRKFFPGRRKKKAEKQASTELGSGEEDSDTPAVVPLSEYDAEKVEDEEEEPAVPAVVQTKVATDDRSPSWIPAVVEDDDKNDQLSDIPEEAENTATPKSADTTIADEIEDQSVRSPGALGTESTESTERRLSTPETTPVLETSELIKEGIVDEISEIPCQKSVAIEDVPIEVATAETEYDPSTEHAESKTDTILELHTSNEAMAICTGIETKEIAAVALEKLAAIPTVESVAVISDAPGTEVLVEEKPECLEAAIATEDPVFEAQVHQVETTELEPAVENSVNEMPEVQCASECHEPEIEKTAIVSTVLEESEIVQSENPPKTVLVEPITPTVEETVCTESMEVTELAVEIKEKEPAVENSVNEVPEVQTASECHEPELEKTEIVSTVLEESEIVQPTEMSENSPKTVLVEPITPTVEETVCTESIEVTELAVEIKEKEGDMVHQVEATELEPVENSVNEMPEVQTASECHEPETEVQTASECHEPETEVQTASECHEPETEIQTASECHEPELEKTAIVSTVLEEPEIVQPTEISENSPKTVLVEPITPTFEGTVCTESVQVTELAVEIKEKELDMEQLTATEDIAPVKEMIQVVSQETTYTLCNTIESTIVKETEPATPAVVPAEEVAIVGEKVVLDAPLTVESEEVESNKEVVIEKALVSEPTDQEPIKVQEIKEEVTLVAEAVADTCIGAAESEVSAIVEQASEEIEDIREEVEQTNAIEEQSMVIAQAVIQNAMVEVSEVTPEDEKPTTPTADITEPVQAVESNEKEIETEMPVVTDTSVAVTYEAPAPKSPQTPNAAIPVIDTCPVEVLESLDTPVQEKEAEEGLKQDVEVNVSEENAVAEEVVELKVESQTGGEIEEVQEEQSKEEAVTQEEEKDVCEEVKPQTEATKSEAPSEENKETVQEVPKTEQMTESQSVEEEAVVESTAIVDSNGPVDTVAPANATDTQADSPASQEAASDGLPALSEEPETIASTEVAAPSKAAPAPESTASPAETERAASGKCAEVMAQVIEVIEEAVKEIEPVSTEITAAS